MDIREYMEAETGLPTAKVAFEKPQKLPFIIISDKENHDGDDFGKREIVQHSLNIEFYAARIDAGNEKKIEAAFKKQGWKLTKERTWFWNEKIFETIYTTNFTEKR